MTTRTIGWMFGIGLAIAPRPAVIAQNIPSQNQPTFRAVTALVPIDVRVLDRRGRPIAGLRAGDFAILEDGAPQTLGHFSVTTLVSAPPPAGAAAIRRAMAPDSAPLAPQTRRLFLIACCVRG